MRIKKKKGQSAIEFMVLIAIVLGSFVAMSFYIKRGIQGGWRDAVDEIGDQYDPRGANSAMRHVMISNQDTVIRTIPSGSGRYTLRTDNSNTIETKRGFESVEAYQ